MAQVNGTRSDYCSFLFRLALEQAPAGTASSARTRARLGWTPAHPTLLEDLEFGDYFAPQAA